MLHQFSARSCVQGSLSGIVESRSASSEALCGRAAGSFARQAWISAASCPGTSSSVRSDGGFNETEIEHLDKVVVETFMTEIDIRRLDVAVDQATLMCLCQGVAGARENVDGTLRLNRPRRRSEHR